MLIAITGPAAAGKSTVARTLQKALSRHGDLWMVMELDTFARGLSRNWIAVGDRKGRYADRGFAYAPAPDGSIQLALGPDGRRVLAGFHASVAAAARSGLNVICETIVYDDADWDAWQAALAGVPTRWVQVSAPVDILEMRERADSTRGLQGLARGMSACPAVGAFAVEANTAAEDVDAIAARIIATLASA